METVITAEPGPLSRTGGRDIHTVHFPVATPPAAVDVLVVGAGPVGLSAAIELSARGVDVAVVDQSHHATLVRAGAMGHSPRTVEHFRRWGLLRAIRDEWTFPPEWNQGIRLVTSLVGHELAPNPRPAFTGSATDRQRIVAEGIRRPQTALQKVFLDDLARRSVTVTGGWRVESLRESADGVTVELASVDLGEQRTVRAQYVIGADGGSSTVRSLAGIQREGERAREKRLRLIVRTGDISDRVGPAPSATNIVVNAKADGFLAAVSEREWRVYAGPYPLDYEPTEDELLETAAAAFGFELDLELMSATTFYAATRIASTFRRGRVVLAGDAAHVRTPGGNLGEGFGDVTNLGWKLAAVLRGQAGDTLLDSYDAERRRHNWRIADNALQSWRRGQAGLAEIRRGGIPHDADLSPVAHARRTEIAESLGHGSGLGGRGGLTFDERYDASPVIWYEPGQPDDEPAWEASRYEDDPRPGHRAPNGDIDPYHSTLYDRIGNDLALLVIGEADADRAVESAFTTEAAARSLPFTVIHLNEPAAREVYGEGFVLVRPDQHVAWRGTRLPDGGAVAVFDHILGIRAAAEVRVPSAAAPSSAVLVGSHGA
jgi:2-polyprenyl-6-methoxyphenol hydroxylase-like FAD-dependent oxidoreductase